jgi:hypothetical protein
MHGTKEMHAVLLSENRKGYHLGDLDINGNIIFKWIFKDYIKKL